MDQEREKELLKKKTQENAIIKFMLKHKKGITSMDAFKLVGATRLSGIIYKIKRRGYKIETTYEAVDTRYDTKAVIARYKIVQD